MTVIVLERASIRGSQNALTDQFVHEWLCSSALS